jgi:hypothetical protein
LDIDNPITEFPASPSKLAQPRFEISERSTELVFGERNLRALIPAIQQLRRECGQEDDLTTDPQYFIAANTLSDRSVAAVLIRKDPALEACLLFFEHRKFGIGHGILHGGDAVGEGLFAGPDLFRWQYIQIATSAMLAHWRIHGVTLTLKGSRACCLTALSSITKCHTFTEKPIQHKLPLAGTYQQMLAGMGPRTRRSLAGKRQKLEASAQVIFLPSLAPAQAFEAMLTLERKSLPPRSTEFYHARHQLLVERPEFFCMGMQFPNGTWLSILSGWRRKGVTYVDFQMNDLHLKKESVSAVMRAYLLEHEIAGGQTLIHFVGGTSVLLRRYCLATELCTDVFLWRPCLRAAFFQKIIPRMSSQSVYARALGATAHQNDPESASR